MKLSATHISRSEQTLYYMALAGTHISLELQSIFLNSLSIRSGGLKSLRFFHSIETFFAPTGAMAVIN